MSSGLILSRERSLLEPRIDSPHFMNEVIRTRSAKQASVFSKSFMKNSSYKFQTLGPPHSPRRASLDQTPPFTAHNPSASSGIPPPSAKPSKCVFYFSSDRRLHSSEALRRS